MESYTLLYVNRKVLRDSSWIFLWMETNQHLYKTKVNNVKKQKLLLKFVRFCKHNLQPNDKFLTATKSDRRLPDKHLAHSLCFRKQVPDFAVHLLIDDEWVAGTPVSHLHGLAGCHHVLPHALWGSCRTDRAIIILSGFSVNELPWRKSLCDMLHTQQWLSLSHPKLVMELLADHPAAGVKLMGGHVGDFQKHSWYQVHTLQQLQVDVHVEWNLWWRSKVLIMQSDPVQHDIKSVLSLSSELQDLLVFSFQSSPAQHSSPACSSWATLDRGAPWHGRTTGCPTVHCGHL